MQGLEDEKMTVKLKETIDKLNEYASGDEYQRATEDAVELLQRLVIRQEVLKEHMKLVAQNLRGGLSKSFQKAQARSIEELLEVHK